MNLLEAVSHLRLNILDDTGGVGVDWASYDEDAFGTLQLRWSNEELTSNINAAISQASRNISPIKDIISIIIKADKNTADIPTNVKKILKVKNSSGKEIFELGINDIWSLEDSETATGDILYWIPDYTSGVIRTYKIQDTDETLSCLVYKLPKNDYSWESDQEVDLELNTDIQIPLLFYAAHLCYLKDEANTLDPNRAATFLGMFEKEFPHTSAYSTLRKERTANRPVRYGGL